MNKRHVRCKYCGSIMTKRNGTRKLQKGFARSFYCFACERYFTTRVNPRSRLGFREKVEIARTHLEGRTSVRTIARHTGHSTKTVCNSIHEVTSQCVSAAWIAKNLNPQWSGYLALDGKMIRVWDWAAKYFRYTKRQRRWLHKMSLLVAMDLGTLDVPCHHLGDEETTIDLVMFLRSLKEMDYPLKGYISDGNEDIEKAVRMVFGKVPHQLCIRHFLENLRDKMRQGRITERQYHDACVSLLNDAKPKLMRVPKELFTYREIKQLPTTNQQIENLNRYFMLRLKTLGQFHSFPSAKAYCNALTLMRRFTAFTDCRDKTKNHKAPLQIAGCNVKELDYLNMLNSSR